MLTDAVEKLRTLSLWINRATTYIKISDWSTETSFFLSRISSLSENRKSIIDTTTALREGCSNVFYPDKWHHVSACTAASIQWGMVIFGYGVPKPLNWFTWNLTCLVMSTVRIYTQNMASAANGVSGCAYGEMVPSRAFYTAAQCIVIGPVCELTCVFVGLLPG